MDWFDSVFSLDSDCNPKVHGTGFACHRDETTQKVFLITCWHVVDKIETQISEQSVRDIPIVKGKELTHLKVKGKQACLVSEPGNDALDLAVLSVPGLHCEKPLRLAIGAAPDLACETYGFGTIGRPFELNLGGPLRRPQPRKDIPAWDWSLRQGTAAWIKAEGGYSGAPVCDLVSGAVVAVLTEASPNTGNRGYAIDIDNLRRVWSDMPSGLLGQDLLLPRLLGDELKRLVRDYVAISGDRLAAGVLLRKFARYALPRTSTAQLPTGPIDALVDQLAAFGPDHEWYPVLSFARQLQETVKDRDFKANLNRWIDDAARSFKLTDVRKQPLRWTGHSGGEAFSPPALLVEIDQAVYTQPPKNRGVRFFVVHDDQPVLTGFDEERDTTLDLDQPDQQRTLATLINRLIYACALERGQALVSFILPDDLLDRDFEHWMAGASDLAESADGDDFGRPLGTALPVVISLRQRHRAGELTRHKQEWQSGWKRQSGHHGKTLQTTWYKCKSGADIQAGLQKGCVCALLEGPFGPSKALRDLLDFGVTSAVWLRTGAQVDAFTHAIKKRHTKDLLGQLPRTILDMRIAIGNNDHPCRHLTLLWDDWAYRLPWSVPKSDEDFFPGTN